MELICANKDTQEEFLSKTYKQPRHLDIKETTQSNRGTRFKPTFLHRRHRDGQEAHEKIAYEVLENCESKVASPQTHQNSQPRKSMTINVGEGMEGKEPS